MSKIKNYNDELKKTKIKATATKILRGMTIFVIVIGIAIVSFLFYLRKTYPTVFMSDEKAAKYLYELGDDKYEYVDSMPNKERMRLNLILTQLGSYYKSNEEADFSKTVPLVK